MRLKFSGHIYKPFHKAELEVLYDEFLFSRDVKVISLKGPTLTALTPIMPAADESGDEVAEAAPEGEAAEGEADASPEADAAAEPEEVELKLSDAYCVRLRAALQSGIRQIAAGSHIFSIVDLRALPGAQVEEFTLLSLEQGARFGLDTRVVMASLEAVPDALKEKHPGGIFGSVDDAITYGDEGED